MWVGVGTDLWIIITVCVGGCRHRPVDYYNSVGVGTDLWIIITVCVGGCRHRPVDYYNSAWGKGGGG